MMLNLPKKLIEAKASLHSLQNFPFIPDLSGLQFVLFGNILSSTIFFPYCFFGFFLA
jgi:ABC-type multidrug transport system permease subunit